MEEAPDALLWIRQDGLVVYANAAACRFLGRPQETLLCTSFFALAPSFRQERWSAVWELLRSEGPVTLDTHYLALDGAPLFVELTARYVRSSHGEHVSAWAHDSSRRRELELALAASREELTRHVRETTKELARINTELRREIAERREAERALRAWEERYRRIGDNVTDVVWTSDLAGRLTYASPSVERLLGYSPFQVVAMNLSDLLSPLASTTPLGRIRAQLDALSGSDFHTVLAELPHKLGHPVPCESTVRYLRDDEGRPVGVIGTTRDISERRRMEEALVRSERLAAVGTLAAGVAHKFNNFNMVILGNVDLIDSEPGLSVEARRRLETIREAVALSSTVAEDLRTFGSVHARDLRPASLSDVAERAVSLLKEDLQAEGIEVVLHLDHVPERAMSPALIAQVILNLVSNARHALLERPVRRLEVRTGSDEDGAYLQVSDTGCGIPEQDLPRVFLPFFSTKGEHCRGNTPQARVHGAGLGLSVSHSIVTSHGGRIEIESQEGVGSTVTVRLPLPGPDPDPGRPTAG
jgi:PAS domain S-box-containing protein